MAGPAGSGIVSAAEETIIREIVENCINSEDITPLVSSKRINPTDACCTEPGEPRCRICPI